MAGKRPRASANRNKLFLKTRIEKMNTVLNKLETEFEKAIKGVLAKGEKSSHELRKTFDEILEWVKNGQLYALASGTKDSVELELRRLKKETLERMKELDFVKSQEFFNEIRTNFVSFLDRFQASPIVETVKTQAAKSKNHILEALNIPNQRELDEISVKVGRLEKRVQALSKKAA